MKKNLLTPAFLLTCGLAAVGCSDMVAFGTHTVYGLDIDTAPQPNFAVGLDRGEAVLGYSYPNGAVSPVVASIHTGGLFSGAAVKQTYATGDAALIVTSQNIPPAKSDLESPDRKKRMVFGTYTNVGLKVAFAANAPKSVNFGFKRQELSLIPVIRETEDDHDSYGSTLAAVGAGAGWAAQDGTEFNYVAFFSTGDAATNLARKELIRNHFITEAKQSFTAEFSAEQQKYRAQVAGVLRCYVAVKDQNKPDVWEDAAARELITVDHLQKFLAWHADGDTDKADRRYGITLFDPPDVIDGKVDVSKTDRADEHEDVVCAASRA